MDLWNGGVHATCHFASLGIEQPCLNRSFTNDVSLYIQYAVAVYPVLPDSQVGKMRLWACIEVYFSGNARQAPKVLVLKIGAVAPAHHLQGDEVFPFFEVSCDVELGSNFRVLTVAHLTTVDPNRQVTRCRAHV